MLGLQRRLTDCFCYRGMRMNGGDNLIQRHLTADRQRTFRNKIGCTRPDNMHAQYFTELLAGNDFDNAFAAVED